MPSLHDLSIPLRSFVQVLSNVVDLVGVEDHAHARRVAMLAVQLSRALGHAPERQQRLYEAAALHDCGVSSTREHRTIMGAAAWAEAQRHCSLGHRRLREFAPLAHLAEIVLHHHSPWSLLVASRVAAGTAHDANLIFLADRIDALSSQDPVAPRDRADRVRAHLLRFGDDVFERELFAAFVAVSSTDGFWAAYSDPEAATAVQAEYSREPEGRVLDWSQFKQGARLIADVVDAKSAFTAEHSLGVACLSRFLAEQYGLGPEDCERIEVAGLLHDLGKLHIPDEILEAARALSPAEWLQMRTHSYLTYEILKPLQEIREVAYWAAGHHERLNGKGYPFQISDGELPLPMRILAVADIYQALAQRRPYRDACPPQQILRELDELAVEQALDASVVAIVRDRLADCQRAAFCHASA